VNTKSNPVTVLIVDDHPQYRKALRLALEMEQDIEVVGEAGDWPALVQATRRFSPDVILMDLRMPFADGIRDGIDATRQILHEHPRTAVIIVTMLADKAYVAMAEKAGAKGYVLKDSGTRELVKTIRTAVQSAGQPKLLPVRSSEHYSDL
jgi:LuxR family maltose regulon positive regulatory protein